MPIIKGLQSAEYILLWHFYVLASSSFIPLRSTDVFSFVPVAIIFHVSQTVQLEMQNKSPLKWMVPDSGGILASVSVYSRFSLYLHVSVVATASTAIPITSSAVAVENKTRHCFAEEESCSMNISISCLDSISLITTTRIAYTTSRRI